jgi:hypothetical protein
LTTLTDKTVAQFSEIEINPKPQTLNPKPRTLERIARGIVKREREQQHSVRVTKASSDIQRCYRGHLGRKIFLVEQETAIEKRIGMASTSIERVYRGHVQRAR